MSTTTITVSPAQVANFIAGKLAEIAVPSTRLRQDIGPIQVDRINLVENNEAHPALQFKFDVAEGMGLEIRVKLAEFAASPAAYIRDLLENLQGIRHAALQRRAGRQAEVDAVYSLMGDKQ